MRTVKILTFFFPLLASAANIESALSLNQSPLVNFTPSHSAASFSSYQLSFGLSEYSFADHLKVSQFLSVLSFDKAQYRYLSQTQADLYSRGNRDLDYSGSTTLGFQKSRYSGSFGVSYPVADNFVERYGLDTLHVVDFFNKSTLLGLQYKYQQENRPENFFLDFDFLVKKRVQKANAHELSLFYEQVLSEALKLRLRPLTILRPEERPVAFGGEVLLSYAPTFDHFLKAKASYVKESRSGLKNERGYLEYLSATAAWDYELNYSNILGLYYSYQKESEENPRNLSKRTLGLDILGATYETKLSAYTLRGDVEFARSNLKTNFLNFAVTLKREI